jgi:hypothetical protein
VGFYTLNPCRVVDTRQAGGATAGAPLTCGLETDFTIVGGTCGVPSGAKAVSLNLAVTQPSAAGNVRVFASGAPAPTASSLNYAAGQTRANNAIAPLSAVGRMSTCSPSDGARDRGRERLLPVAAVGWPGGGRLDAPGTWLEKRCGSMARSSRSVLVAAIGLAVAGASVRQSRPPVAWAGRRS